MLRFVNICLVLGLVALAYVIYQVKYEARALDEEIASLNKDIDTERDGLALLRAEWSLLNRPERIERLAEKYLKLAPVQPRQLVTLDSVRDRDFTLSRVEVAATTPTPAEVAGHGAEQAGKVTALGATSPEATSATAAAAAAPWPTAKIDTPLQAAAQ
ncbi:MAG: cell division protein FtsL [Methyloceanibacter sp.]